MQGIRICFEREEDKDSAVAQGSQILENEVFPERNRCGHSQDEPKITGQDAEETQNIPKMDR